MNRCLTKLNSAYHPLLCVLLMLRLRHTIILTIGMRSGRGPRSGEATLHIPPTCLHLYSFCKHVHHASNYKVWHKIMGKKEKALRKLKLKVSETLFLRLVFCKHFLSH